MKLIDMKTYPKRNQYNWFIQYQNPAYGFDVDIDCTEVVKEQSFFPHFLYRIMLAINSIPELKMRVVDGKPYSYDVIHPTFTVMTKQGVYQNCGFEMKENFPLFYQTCRALIDEVKELEVNDELDRFPICKTPNVVFLTSIPTLDDTSSSHWKSGKSFHSKSVLWKILSNRGWTLSRQAKPHCQSCLCRRISACRLLPFDSRTLE